MSRSAQSLGLICILLLCILPATTRAKTKGGNKKVERETKGAAVQRIPKQAQENVRNTISNISYYQSNYGIFGMDITHGKAGVLWPRDSSNLYIFGGGLWFSVQKQVRDANGTVLKAGNGADSLNKLCVMGYNPNTGRSSMVPGAIDMPLSNQLLDSSTVGINRNRVYLSTEYNSLTGEPADVQDAEQGGPNWPMWDTRPVTLKTNHYFGDYVEDPLYRNLTSYPKGPAIISSEDVFSTYRDNDLSSYEIGPDSARQQGYPIGIQVEQTNYNWDFGDYANFMFIKYLIINRSTDTLWHCWSAPTFDMDLGLPDNDHNKIVIDDATQDSLDLVVQWSEAETKRYGYVGLDLLESPAVDQDGYIRGDKSAYPRSEQIGLQTFKKWTIELDPGTSEARYDYTSARTRDGDNGHGDTRWLMGSGPFIMRPGDTAHVVLGLIFAYGQANTPNGTWSDMHDLIELDRFAQRVYDSSLRTSTSEVNAWEKHSSTMSLGQNHPNPFGPALGGVSSTVPLFLSKGARITLSIFNELGMELRRQELGWLTGGEHQLRIDAAGLAPGSYFYEVRSAEESARGRMVVE